MYTMFTFSAVLCAILVLDFAKCPIYAAKLQSSSSAFDWNEFDKKFDETFQSEFFTKSNKQYNSEFDKKFDETFQSEFFTKSNEQYNSEFDKKFDEKFKSWPFNDKPNVQYDRPKQSNPSQGINIVVLNNYNQVNDLSNEKNNTDPQLIINNINYSKLLKNLEEISSKPNSSPTETISQTKQYLRSELCPKTLFFDQSSKNLIESDLQPNVIIEELKRHQTIIRQVGSEWSTALQETFSSGNKQAEQKYKSINDKYTQVLNDVRGYLKTLCKFLK